MSTSINSPVDQLCKEYKTISEKARRYKIANFIFDFPREADITYLKLVRDKYIAYMEYKKVELGTARYNKLIHPVYTKKLMDVELLLKERGGSA